MSEKPGHYTPIIDDRELNRLYGKAGTSFTSHAAATEHAAGMRHARIYSLWDGVGAQKIRVGYLVCDETPPPSKRRFTGKVRLPG